MHSHVTCHAKLRTGFPALFLTVLLFLHVGFLAGCGLPDALKKRAEAMKNELSSLSAAIDKRAKTYEELEKTGPFISRYKTCADRENWGGSFDKARLKLGEGQNILSVNAAALIKKNSRKDQQALDNLLNTINDLKVEAQSLSVLPANRMQLIDHAEKNAAAMKEKAVADLARQRLLMTELVPQAEKARKNHPNKNEAITAKMTPIETRYKKSMESMTVIQRETTSTSPDYAYFADACTAINQNLTFIEKEQPLVYAKLGELDRSYSKTLIDMTAEYYVQIGRISWQESEYVEYPPETEYTYPPAQVDDETFEYFSEWPDEDNVGKVSGFFGMSFSPEVDKAMWARLNLDPMAGWPSSDNTAEYFVKETPSRLFHKYRILEDGKMTETGWVAVSEDFFYDNEQNLGMDLMVKPYGYFEEEAVKTATPQGMAYVGNPRYGRWVTGRDGLSFWEFYGMYSLMNNLIGMRYSRPDYDMWYRDYRGKRPYYGREKDEDRYGSGGVFTRTRYAGSYYSRSGGFRRMEDSVRGAGAGSRGRGPGGGGK